MAKRFHILSLEPIVLQLIKWIKKPVLETSGLFKRCYEFVGVPKHKKGILKIISSLVLASLLSVATYVLTNRPISDGKANAYIGDLNFYFGFDGSDRLNTATFLENVVCINVAFDKEIVTYRDSISGVTRGEMAITNREKLATLLEISKNQHKYMFIDILLDPEVSSVNDSLLYSALSITERVLVPSYYKGGQLVTPDVSANTGFSGFKVTDENERFLKYSFIHTDSIKSVALRMYEELDNGELTKGAIFDTSNGDLSLSSLLLALRVGPFDQYRIDGRLNYYDLGTQLLDSLVIEKVSAIVKDKIVLVGDFESSDEHLTQIGHLAGPIIHYNAYLALQNNDHKISNTLIATVFFVFFLFLLNVLFSWNVSFWAVIKVTLMKKKWLKQGAKNKALSTIYHLFLKGLFVVIDASLLLLLLSYLVYNIFGIHMDVFWLSIPFIFLIIILHRIRSPQKFTI
tara:strand:- start:16353 stop:17726 length:1374 start_codon:yes stop_codon:yes gene_type:complete